MPGAIAVETSNNSKTGPVSATYVSQTTCPAACPFLGSGCYAESGHTRFTLARINHGPETIQQLALEEAQAIRGLTGWLPLRVHVVGDCPTDESAMAISGAMRDHSRKHGMPSWTYTHAWRDVARASWARANVLASTESHTAALEARQRGYSTAIVVDHFEGPKRQVTPDGETIIPCPQQTGKSANCRSCGLCFNPGQLAQRLEAGVSIGFAVHGAQSKRARAQLGKDAPMP